MSDNRSDNRNGAPHDRAPHAALDHLVREAKTDLKPNLGDDRWVAIEGRVLARVANERAGFVDEARPSGRSRTFQIAALALAVAAATALVIGKDPGGGVIDSTKAPPQATLDTDSLRGADGTGDVRVGGVAASPGHVLRAGDVIETDGARALLERPRKVTWLLERVNGETSRGAARTRVKSVGESLVLSLEEGAIEAQVTPVPAGEAFAIDVVDGSSLVRVAVHGTHLRVARSGSHVVVDLTEGVVSIGVPPRIGSTYGTLVTAPSHVEFDVTDLQRTLRVDPSPAAVRAAVALSFQAPPLVVRNDDHAALSAPPSTVAPVAIPAPSDRARRQGDPAAQGSVVKVAKPKAPVAPRTAIAAAVRDCARAHSRPASVHVTVTSSLTLKVAAGGRIESARFDPPLMPEIQTCASEAIYKVKDQDAAGTTVTIPIDFSY